MAVHLEIRPIWLISLKQTRVQLSLEKCGERFFFISQMTTQLQSILQKLHQLPLEKVAAKFSPIKSMSLIF